MARASSGGGTVGVTVGGTVIRGAGLFGGSLVGPCGDVIVDAVGGVAPVAHRPHHQRGAAHDRSEEHTSELQSLMRISYAVFCLNKKITTHSNPDSHFTSRHSC